MAAFEVDTFVNSTTKIAESLNALFPELLRNTSKELLLDSIEKRLGECDRLGIFTERERFSYMSVEYLFGAAFYKAPAFTSLFSGDLSGDNVMKVFFEKLKSA